jgi:hypothetical protein
MRWPGIEGVYGETLKGTSVFGVGDESTDRYKDLHTRVIEHVSGLQHQTSETDNRRTEHPGGR